MGIQSPVQFLMKSMTTVVYSFTLEDEFLNMSQSTESKQSCSFSSTSLVLYHSSLAPRASVSVCKQEVAAQRSDLIGQSPDVEGSSMALSGAGDVLVVLSVNVHKVGLGKIPRNHEQSARVCILVSSDDLVQFT